MEAFSCGYCEIFKSSFFCRPPLVAASGIETFVIQTIFQDNFLYGDATSSHIFRVTTSTQQLHFRRSYFFQSSCFFLLFQSNHFLAELFFQNSFFFRANIHFLRIKISSLWQLIFGTTNFSLFRITISKKELLFQSRYFCTVSTFSEKLHFGKS